MGQKVSPVGLRIGINKTWESQWYASGSDFAKFLKDDNEIRKIVKKSLKDAALSSVIIKRKNDDTEVILNTAKPGVVIGHNGELVEKLRKTISKKMGYDIQISIMEIKKPELDARLVARDIANQIEGRVSFRMAQKRAIRSTLRGGAKGIKTAVSGRLGGAEMARTEGYTEGSIPLHTLRADIDYAHEEADTTYGKIGVKVWIYKGEILPENKGGNNNGVNTKKN